MARMSSWNLPEILWQPSASPFVQLSDLSKVLLRSWHRFTQRVVKWMAQWLQSCMYIYRYRYQIYSTKKFQKKIPKESTPIPGIPWFDPAITCQVHQDVMWPPPWALCQFEVQGPCDGQSQGPGFFVASNVWESKRFFGAEVWTLFGATFFLAVPFAFDGNTHVHGGGVKWLGNREFLHAFDLISAPVDPSGPCDYQTL